jgi:hypothetical protein
MISEWVANYIKNLGRQAFNSVATLILKDAFFIQAINVDGRCDGGSDRRVFKDSGGSTTAAYQVTVQDAQWATKAIDDARKSVRELDATRYFFLTSREHSNTDLRALENQITTELKIPATCLGAKEIAELIVRHHLEGVLLELTGVPSNIPLNVRPDRKEILLYSYLAMSDDRRDLRAEIYDDTILFAVRPHENGLKRSDMVKEAISILGCDPNRSQKLESRVDALIQKGVLTRLPSDLLALSPDAQQALQVAEQVYQQEFNALTAMQMTIIHDQCKINWSEDDSRQVSLLLARAFIQKQIDVARYASMELTALGLVKYVGDPLQDLRDYLRNAGISIPSIDGVILQLVDAANNLPLVKKLASAALFVTMEGANPLSSLKALGANQWSDVHCVLDSSVAIPYLCARMYSPTTGRFSGASVESIRLLQQLGARTYIPFVYLTECASHLIRAWDFTDIDGFDEELSHSPNGFIAHYYQLKLTGQQVPKTVREYLINIAPAIAKGQDDRGQWRRRIQAELQPVFRDYNVDFEFVQNSPAVYRQEVEQEFSYVLAKLKRNKPKVLTDNDVTILAHMKRLVCEKGLSHMCLTWDLAMVEAGHQIKDCGWIISPSDAADIIQPYAKGSASKLCSLAHALARTREVPYEIGGQILNRIIHYAKEKLQDWEFRKEIAQFKESLLKNLDVSQFDYRDQIDAEIEEFLKAHGVDTSSGLTTEQEAATED